MGTQHRRNVTDLTPLRRPSPPLRHPDDVARLRAALEEWGYTASDGDLQWAWEQYSDNNWAAGWISLEMAGPESVWVHALLGNLQPEGTDED